jgi:P-type Mg2+ transporter
VSTKASSKGGTADAGAAALSLAEASALRVEAVAERLASSPGGLASLEAARRLSEIGPNAIRTHHARALAVLLRQFRSTLLLLLLVTAVVSAFLGEGTDAAIIGAILTLSAGLGFVNEYRAERAVEALHEQIRHDAPTLRDGTWVDVDVTDLVPGDIVELELGMIVPADLRLTEATNLACDEAVLTGEAEPVEKATDPVGPGLAIADLTSCALMGTIVREGSGRGIVVATGGGTVFGGIALGLGGRQPETAFQIGLRRFSGLLAKVAAVLTGSIFVVNLLLERPVIDALLFSLAIAVGITPQLLPAVVTTSLATGSRRLARRKVLVKRLVGIEDLGNVEVLFTDKTGTLTEGLITFRAAIDPSGRPDDEVLRLGLVCNEATDGPQGAVGGNALDRALWEAPEAHDLAAGAIHRIALLPFDHERRMTSALIENERHGRLLVTKGAPESVLERCAGADEARAILDTELVAGGRVVAVATRPASGLERIGPGDEKDLELAGFLVFLDPPKATAKDSLARLDRLRVEIKIVTGDHPVVAEKVCADLGLASAGTITGAQVDELDDDALARALVSTTIFARMSPEQKARIIRLQRSAGRDVGFLGDGVNDALALHEADVGISVDAAVDIAKDAADVVLLEKDLGVLADGVVEGRRIFSNTMKYVLMGTSSNFGNMFSAAGASAFLSFLPMLPSQILLNNLLYDAGEMTIPTDNVDEEQLERPSRWDIGFIERFMLVFGPVSSLFDFATFALMIGVFHFGADTFRSGWFVESICTQTLVIFVIRTRRVPFYRSRPSRPLLVATLVTVAIGSLLPISPLADVLGFGHLSPQFYLALVAMVATYLVLVELVKQRFFHRHGQPRPLAVSRPEREERIHRRAFRWSHEGELSGGRARS